MIGATTTSWAGLNQRHLMAAVNRVRAHLQRSTGTATPPEASDAALEGFASSALDTLCATFAPTPFERDILTLCAAMELDGQFSETVAAAQRHPRRDYPTFGLALATFPDAHWSALSPAAPLRYWRLIEVGAGDTLTGSRLRIDERVLHYLAGVACTDERLQGLLEPPEHEAELVPSHQALAGQVADHWQNAPPGKWFVIQLCGPAAAEKRGIAAAACALRGERLSVLPASALPGVPAEADLLARLWQREAALAGAVPFLDADAAEAAPGAREDAVASFLDRLTGPVVVATRERRPLRRRGTRVLTVPPPSSDEQRDVWHRELAGRAGLNGHVEEVVAQFRLHPSAIASAAAEVRGTDAETGPRLWEACRTQARSRLQQLAQRLEPVAGWADLVLPDAATEMLRQIAAQVRQRLTVHETWGFGRGARGLGVSALFVGPSGTGKTMAAEVLARELRLDLACIDLSQVVNKYIGETEKNLGRIFDAAEEGGAVLLFDEADALFGKRSEVKDSHDRYANIEVGYLLQRMEAYRGLAILTTNLKDAIDPAFLRRLRFVVRFPFPDQTLREAIWRRVFPKETPTADLDPGKLARLNVAGGHIRNIALAAAFLAADAGEPVRMSHLQRAAQTEYAKLERPLTDAEIGGWL